MVILLIYELGPKLLICENKKKRGGLSNIVPPPSIDTSRRLYLE